MLDIREGEKIEGVTITHGNYYDKEPCGYSYSIPKEISKTMAFAVLSSGRVINDNGDEEDLKYLIEFAESIKVNNINLIQRYCKKWFGI